jgi:DNA-nicking Smr family endonuclease
VLPPADVSNQRKVRRGQMAIDGQIDLHGHTYDDALAELARFLLQEQAHGSRCVLVITGKGRVLRTHLTDWLDAPELRPIIAGFSKAHARHGGDGAFYVLLKAKRAHR